MSMSDKQEFKGEWVSGEKRFDVDLLKVRAYIHACMHACIHTYLLHTYMCTAEKSASMSMS